VNTPTLIHQPQETVALLLAARLLTQLERGRRVLWLLSGGSGGRICVETSRLLAGHNLSSLYITLSDERYGTQGHADENFQQLVDMGFHAQGATFYRPLSHKDRHETTQDFAAWLEHTSQLVDYRIALLGMGADGHTSGIKPHSPAVSSSEAAVDFTGDDYERISTTASFLLTLDEAVLQVFGSDKHLALRDLLAQAKTLDEQPAQIIYKIPRVTLVTDYVAS